MVYRHIQKDFSIRVELMCVLAVWLMCNSFSVGFFVFFENLNITDASEFILLFRSLLTILIVVTPPLYYMFKGTYIPIPPNRENIEQLDMVLHIPIAAEFFFNYLEEDSNVPCAPIYFALYADLRFYDKACADE